MKPNRPSLYLYFLVCILIILFKIFENDSIVMYLRSILSPIMFMYYLITNNYKISWVKACIFLFCFIGDIFFFISFLDTIIGGLLSFMIVYSLLIKMAFDNFLNFDFNKKDRMIGVILLFLIAIICTSVLSLEYEGIKPDFYIYIIYGIFLSILSFLSISNYIKKRNFTYFSLFMMCMCFVISDVFFIINEYYLSLYTFSFLNIYSIFFSYFFMTTYFIENDKQYKNKNIV